MSLIPSGELKALTANLSKCANKCINESNSLRGVESVNDCCVQSKEGFAYQ